MKKKEIEVLVKESFPDIEIKIKFVPGSQMGNWAAVLNIDGDNRTLHLSKVEFSKKCEDEDQLVILLHELGHIPNDDITSVSLDEYNAQIWAINKAKEKGWTEVQTRLIKDILSWGEFKWNEDKGQFRRYIIASKKFKEEFLDDKTRTHSTAKIRAHASTVVRKNRDSSLRHFRT